jgi:SPP1 gp7 family putative phage head morphogenesis protein
MSHLAYIRARKAAQARVERLAGEVDRILADAARSAIRNLPSDPQPEDLQALARRLRTAGAAINRQLAQAFTASARQVATLTYQDHRSVSLQDAERALRRRPRRQEDIFGDLKNAILPRPNASLLLRIVGRAPDRMTALLTGERLSSVMVNAIAAGWDRRKIGRELESAFGATASAARRIARTEGLRIATESQLAVSEQLQDLIIGYEISAVLDSRTRPEHRKRHGTRYYRNPKPGQLGFDKMPRPPLEANGEIAHNCRCFLIPIFE